MGLKKYREFTQINEGWSDENDQMSDPKIPRDQPFKCLEIKSQEIGIFRNLHTNEYYCFYFGDMDKSEFYEYASLPMYQEYDEDYRARVWQTDTESFEFDKEIIENYVNDNITSLNYGEGLEDYQTQEANFILIDEPLKKELKESFRLESI